MIYDVPSLGVGWTFVSARPASAALPTSGAELSRLRAVGTLKTFRQGYFGSGLLGGGRSSRSGVGSARGAKRNTTRLASPSLVSPSDADGLYPSIRFATFCYIVQIQGIEPNTVVAWASSRFSAAVASRPSRSMRVEASQAIYQ